MSDGEFSAYLALLLFGAAALALLLVYRSRRAATGPPPRPAVPSPPALTAVPVPLTRPDTDPRGLRPGIAPQPAPPPRVMMLGLPGAHRHDAAWPDAPSRHHAEPRLNEVPYARHRADTNQPPPSFTGDPEAAYNEHPYSGQHTATYGDHALVRQTSSRLRRPAYLDALPAPGPQPGPGRHRAPEPAGLIPAAAPPPEWPPHPR
jgi:hypothetical protein